MLDQYGFKSDAEAKAYNKNPVDNLAGLAAAKVPLLHVYGEADEVVNPPVAVMPPTVPLPSRTSPARLTVLARTPLTRSVPARPRTSTLSKTGRQ